MYRMYSIYSVMNHTVTALSLRACVGPGHPLRGRSRTYTAAYCSG